jgi:hypothetical protein
MLAVEGLVFSAVVTSYCIAEGRIVTGRSMAAVPSHTGWVLPHQDMGEGGFRSSGCLFTFMRLVSYQKFNDDIHSSLLSARKLNDDIYSNLHSA